MSIKALIRKAWDAVVTAILRIPRDKELHFVAGLLVGSFVCIVFHCPVPLAWAAVVGILKETFDVLTTETIEPWDIGATLIGGLVIQTFAILGGM